MLNKNLKPLIERYSFIDTVETKGIYFIFNYMKEGKKKSKKLPLRASIIQVQKLIKKIEKDIGVGKYGKANIGQIYTT